MASIFKLLSDIGYKLELPVAIRVLGLGDGLTVDSQRVISIF